MATTLIKNAEICAPGSAHHGKKRDVVIAKGKIAEIGKDIAIDTRNVIDEKGSVLTPGWFDLHVRFNDPGREYKEDIQSGAEAAAHGGFTRVLLSPDTDPVTDSKGIVRYLLENAARLPVRIEPSGALSVGLKGNDMSEMYDMYRSGVKVFHDDKNAIYNPDLLRRCLLYTKTIGARVMSFSNEKYLSANGVMNEGKMNTYLGLRPMPAIAEEIQIRRDLQLAQYCETPLHFSCISTAGAVKLIKEAKRSGIPVTCDVPYMNLVLTDELMSEFDSNLKLNPPLRTERDRKALIKGILDGTIDAVTSDHTPHNIEEKDCEFDLAAFGMSSVETLYPVYQTFLSGDIPLEVMVRTLTSGPDLVLGETGEVLDKGAPADLTLIAPDAEQEIDEAFFSSKSTNNYWKGQKLKGKVLKTFVSR